MFAFWLTARIRRCCLVCQACVPLSPLCLPYLPFASSSVSLLLPAAAVLSPTLASLGVLFCSTAESSLSFTVWKRMPKRVATKGFVRRLGGVSLRKFDSMQPVKTQPRQVFERLPHGTQCLGDSLLGGRQVGREEKGKRRMRSSGSALALLLLVLVL